MKRQRRNLARYWAARYMMEGEIEKDDPKYERLTDEQREKIHEARAAYIEVVRVAANCIDIPQ